MNDPDPPTFRDASASKRTTTPAVGGSTVDGRVQEQLDTVSERLDRLVAALDADGDGLAGRLLAHQEAWERQAEARVTANTRRVDELMVTLETSSGSLAALERAVSTLSSKVERLAADSSAKRDVDTTDETAAQVSERIDGSREELLMKQVAFVAAMRDAVQESTAAETTRRTAEEAEFRKEQKKASQAMADAVLEALDANASADAVALEQLRTEVSEIVDSVRAGLVTEVANVNATETEQVRTVLNSAVQRMVDAQSSTVHAQLSELVGSFEKRLDQLADAFQLESAVVAGLRAEIRESVDRSAEATVTVVRNEITELRAGLQNVEEVSTRTADWLRTDRSEASSELRTAIVGVAQANFDRVTDMVTSSLEAAATQNAELVKAELTAFQTEVQALRTSTTSDFDRVSKLVQETIDTASTEASDSLRRDLTGELTKVREALLEASGQAIAESGNALQAELAKVHTDGQEARTATADKLDAVTKGLHTDVAALQSSIERTLADLAAGDITAMAELRSDLRSVIDRTTSDTISAMRSDVAGVRAALGAVELSTAAAADGIAAMRADSGQTIRDGLRNDLEGLVAQLGFGLAATIERADDRSIEAVREELTTIRLEIEESLRAEARQRERALQEVREELTASFGDVGQAITGVVEVSTKASQERVDSLRVEVEAALIALRTQLRESLAKASGKELATRLGEEVGGTLGSLEAAITQAFQQDQQTQAEQQVQLRDELADALAAVAQLVVDTSRGESQARTQAFEVTGQRIDQLARAIGAVVTAQTDLRAAFLQRFS